MNCRALALQSRAQQIDWVDHAGAQCAAEGTDTRCHDIPRGGVVFVDVAARSVAGGDEAFEVFECGEVDSRVREHTDEAHGKPTIEGADTVRGEHLAGCGEDKGIAVEAAFHGFVLNAAGRG